MQAQDVQDILTLDHIVESFPHTPDGKHSLIAALIDWKGGASNGSAVEATPVPEPEPEPAAPAAAKTSRAKAKPGDEDSDF